MLRNAYTDWSPPAPHYTEKGIADQKGKVCIVTGANSGVGYEVARILYSKNATVYAAGRSEEKTTRAVAAIRDANPESRGRIDYLHLDLADLTTIKSSADAFIAKERVLHCLYNNAGVMVPPDGSVTVQGHELQLGVNCLGHHLFTKILTPTLVETAKTAPKDTVRVIWVSSSVGEYRAPQGGVPMDNLDYKKSNMSSMVKYGVSKAGNYYQATEFARRHANDGIISVSLNPGNLKSELGRTASLPIRLFRRFNWPTIYGAYTELFAGTSPDVSMEKTGSWIVPWGRFRPVRKDLRDGARPESEGGTGVAMQFWQWCDEQVAPHSPGT